MYKQSLSPAHSLLIGILPSVKEQNPVPFFLLPTEENEILDKGEAVLKMLETLGLENIKVRFIPAKQAYSHYLTGTKMDITQLNL